MKTAASIGEENLRKPEIQKFIAEAMKSRSGKPGRTVDDVLRDIQQATKDAWAEGDIKTVLRGLEMEGRHLGMFQTKIEVTAFSEDPPMPEGEALSAELIPFPTILVNL
jgi:phage terminase small subunit